MPARADTTAFDRGPRDAGQLLVGEAEFAPTQLVFVEDARPEQERVVGVDGQANTGRQQIGQGMLRQRGNDAEHDVRRRADVETNSGGRELFDETGHFERAHAVLDAMRTQEVDRVLHEPTGLEFTSVGRDQQAAVSGDAEAFDEVLRRVADFVVVQTEADHTDPVVDRLQCKRQLRERNGRGFVVEDPVDRRHEPNANAVTSRGFVEAGEDGLPGGLVAAPDCAMRTRPERRLDVDRPVVGCVLADLVGEAVPVLAATEEAGRSQTHFAERREAAVATDRGQRFAVLLRKGSDRRRPHRLLEMEVQMALRKGTEVARRVRLAHAAV